MSRRFLFQHAVHALSGLTLALCASACGNSFLSDDDPPETAVNANLPAEGPEQMSFFVTSTTHLTGNLGGLEGADEECQDLAEAAGNTAYTWQAYLGAENDGDPIHPGSRIGNGPWKNFNGVTIAGNVSILHVRPGDADLFLDESGEMINGQWTDSPGPVEHDILTGANLNGTVAMTFTCGDWTSDSADLRPRVGHTDGFGRDQDVTPPRNSWNAAHEGANCGDFPATGGAGRFYCFAIDEMPE